MLLSIHQKSLFSMHLSLKPQLFQRNIDPRITDGLITDEYLSCLISDECLSVPLQTQVSAPLT